MERIYDEDVCCCALNRIFGFKPRIALALISSLGSASQVFRLKAGELDRLLGTDAPARRMICRQTLSDTAEELDGLYGKGYSFIRIGSSGYPKLLAECEDPPLGLYVRRMCIRCLGGNRAFLCASLFFRAGALVEKVVGEKGDQ